MNMKSLFIGHFKKHWPEYLIIILLGVLYSVSQIDVVIDWIGDKDVWLNTIISTIIIYYAMGVITSKIKNQYIAELINLILALVIGQILVFSFDPIKIRNKWTWGLVISGILFFLGMGIQGLSGGFRKVIKEHERNLEGINNASIDVILKSIKELEKALNFVKRNPDSAYRLTTKEKVEETTSLLERLKSHPKYIEYISNHKNKKYKRKR